MKKLTPEELEQFKTPEMVRAKFGEPVSVIDLPNTYWMFYRNFHFQFKPEKRDESDATQSQNK